MRKRPLCFVAVAVIFIQVLLVKGRLIGYDQAFSFLSEDKIYVAEVTGTVYKKEQKSKSQILYLKDSRVILDNKSIDHSKVQVRIEPNISIKIGNKITCSGKATGFQSARNPGNFDTKKYYAARGIYIQLKAEQIKILNAKHYPMRETLFRLRMAWKTLLFDQLGEQYGSVMAAMLTGEKSELDEETSKLYKQIGISHILAISGLHMSFIGLGVYRLLRKLGISFINAGVASFLFLAAYTVLTGCGVSSIRALFMFFIRMGAEITGRDYDMATAMGVTAVGMCFKEPLYLLDEGFLLSYIALAGITIVVPSMLVWVNPQKKATKALIAGLAIQINLLPVLLYFYYEFSTYAVLINCLVLPGMGAVLGAGMLGSFVGIFWWKGANIIFYVAKYMLVWYETLGKGVCKLPASVVITGKPMFLGVCLYYLILYAVCYSVIRMTDTKRKIRKGRVAVIFTLTLSSVLFLSCMLPKREQGKLIVTMLDVGQGDGIYIRTPGGQTMFVDGGSSNVTNVGEKRIGPFLKSKGVRTLDYVLISHGDADHKNGIEELLTDQQCGIRIDTLLLPPKNVWDEGIEKLVSLAKENDTKVLEFKEGQTMEDELFCMECLAPGKTYEGKAGNEASMVFEIRYQTFRMLFTGDLEGTGERNLEESGMLKRCTVLKVAHHGSKNSTSEKFIKEVKPSIALISSGIHNRYGHPDCETLQRLEQHGCYIFQTQKNGAITLKTDGQHVQIYENIE